MMSVGGGQTFEKVQSATRGIAMACSNTFMNVNAQTELVR